MNFTCEEGPLQRCSLAPHRRKSPLSSLWRAKKKKKEKREREEREGGRERELLSRLQIESVVKCSFIFHAASCERCSPAGGAFEDIAIEWSERAVLRIVMASRCSMAFVVFHSFDIYARTVCSAIRRG